MNIRGIVIGVLLEWVSGCGWRAVFDLMVECMYRHTRFGRRRDGVRCKLARGCDGICGDVTTMLRDEYM